MVDVLPYGSWPSPLSASWASAAAPRFEGAAFVGDEIWWGESVPTEGGRTAVRRLVEDGIDTVLPAPWNARSRVHEYGGGSWAADGDGRLFFVEKTDQRVWLRAPGAAPRPLTPADPNTAFGGLRWQHGVLLAVRERQVPAHAARRDLVRIDVDGDGSDASVTPLVGGSDFVAQPALSPSGARLAWVAWNHPDMPWDRTELRIGELVDGRVASWRTVSSGQTAALQPEWVGDDLLYVDDPTGRWNLWRAGADTPAVLVRPADADTGGPLWVLGPRWYAPLPGGRVAAVRTNGCDELVVMDAGGTATRLDVPPTARMLVEDADGDRLLISGAARGANGVWLVEVDSGAVRQVAGGTGTTADTTTDWFPVGRPVTFTGIHGEVHAFDFPPTNPEVAGPGDELPPYVVFVHGGPTAHVGGVADAKTAFFTSRGIGVLDVNYGGSTGYGRAYRERLRGQWGVVDVDDVATAASGLAAEGRADAGRLAIEGGSAGGWTVLAALATTDVFAAGISRYGVADARALAADTHDFESRYLDGLIGPLPEAEPAYLDRSPLSRIDGFTVPVLLLQGSDDAVVPPAQSEAIRDALRAAGVPHAYVLYEGEGHGFRRAETIVHALESELAFLGRVFGFETPGIPPIALG
ncbi:prolyl oligopeptidase family serine peptidase [Microbacterium sp.]|uniref:dipeptidyl-peptidase 5 n=1 Tax=Microbacterium sp. TaxID=51671 RepID=UPI0039E3F2BD